MVQQIPQIMLMIELRIIGGIYVIWMYQEDNVTNILKQAGLILTRLLIPKSGFKVVATGRISMNDGKEFTDITYEKKVWPCKRFIGLKNGGWILIDYKFKRGYNFGT